MPPSPDQIDRERIGTVKRSFERKTLQDAIVQANTRLEILLPHQTDPVFEVSKQDLEIAKKRLELFDAEHDPSGAWKGNRFGSDVAKMFEHDFIQESHGMLVPTEELKQTHLLTVSMNELDRLNKEGGHALGDEGMGLAYKSIAEKVEAKLHDLHPELKPEELAANYDIYRTGGNEFSVVIRKVTTPFSMQELASSFVSVDAVTEKYPGIEAPPLAANHAGMADVYEVLNSLRREEGMEDFKGWENKEKTKLAVSVVKDVLMSENDVRKTRLRLDRFEGLLKAGDADKARGFYDNYLKKALGAVLSGDESALATFDEAQAIMKQMGAFDEAWSTQWEKEKSQIAIDEGCKILRREGEVARSGEENLHAATVQRVRQRYEEAVPVYGPQPKGIEAFIPPLATEGLHILQQKRQAASEAKAMAQQDKSVLASKKAEVIDLDYRIEAARRDSMTGLEQRGVLFADMEDALKRNETMSTLFIDMAFLKYFDKVGGSSVGDMAIKKSAEILDALTRDEQIKAQYPQAKIKVYRYAGDEFVVSVQGADNSVADALRQRILEKAYMAGNVPKAVSSGEGYTPERISFNVGTSHAEGANDLEAQVLKLGLPLHGEPGSKDRLNHLAEYAIRFADKEIDITKAMDRYELLMGLMIENGEDDPHVQQMLTYSQKAIFGKEGEAKIKSWVNKLGENPAETERISKESKLDLLEFTLAMKDRELAQKNDRDQAVERRIENHIRLQYLDRRIDTLEKKIAELAEALTEAQALGAQERESHAQAKAAHEEELEKIKNLRSQFTQ